MVRRYSPRPVDILIGAVSYAQDQLRGIGSQVLERSETGDIVTPKDRIVHRSVVEYLSRNGIRALVNGEEGATGATKPEYLLLIDPIEGTQNAVNGLDHGINIAIAPYRSQLRVRDLKAAAVCNLRDGVTYVGERGKRPFKIIAGEKKDIPTPKQTDLYEAPLPTAYTTDRNAINRQQILGDVFRSVLGNQPRSVDATGTRLVALLEGNIRAYGDWRHATKCWDVLPSALLLEGAGFTVTDVFGISFDDLVFFDQGNPRFSKDHGLNRRIGENFIAASPVDHEALVFGEKDSVWKRAENEWLKPRPTGLYQIGSLISEPGGRVLVGLDEIVHRRKQAYGDLNESNVHDIVKKVKDRTLATSFRNSLSPKEPAYLKRYAEMIASMPDSHFSPAAVA